MLGGRNVKATASETLANHKTNPVTNISLNLGLTALCLLCHSTITYLLTLPHNPRQRSLRSLGIIMGVHHWELLPCWAVYHGRLCQMLLKVESCDICVTLLSNPSRRSDSILSMVVSTRLWWAWYVDCRSEFLL